MSTALYHPETGHSMVVPDEAVPHWARSGWWTQADWDAKAAADEAAAQAEKPAAPARRPAAGASGER